MSFRSQELRELVVQRLAVAADEIFALFEQTFAEYEQEIQRKILQEPRAEPQTSQDLDVRNLLVQTDIDPHLERVKFEEKEIPLEVQFSPITVKSEDNGNKGSFLQQEPSEEQRPVLIPEQCDADDAGCSLDLNIKEFEPCHYSDTDNSDDWMPSSERRTKADGHSNNIYHMNFQHQQDFTEEGASSQSEQLQADGHSESFSDCKDKPFSCAVCGKSFPQKRILKAHMRIHTGEKPYHCKPCGLSFRFQQNYFQHDLAVHRKDKPYRCRICKADFVQKLEMIAHRNTHNMKSVTCPTCSKVFNSARYLRRHMDRCPRKKRRQSAARADCGAVQTAFSSQSSMQQDGQRFDSRVMLNTSVNEWL